MVMIGLSVHEDESRGRPTRQISWQDSVTDHPTRTKRQKKYSVSS